MQKVAVLIPTYKPKEYFEKCLISLENQTLKKDSYCVYIALNGPSENYENYIFKLLEKVSFNYCYIYIEEANVSKARNKLIEITSEEFIVFIDDDDLISQNYLENLLKVSTNKFMGIANVFNFEKDINNLKENYMGNIFESLDDGETSKYKTRKYFSSACAKMLHRNMIQDIRFDENVSKGEDSLFMAMISKNIFGVRKASSDTCYYVFERTSSTTRQKVNLKKDVKTIFYLVFQYIKLCFKRDYETMFILTRIAATLLKLVKIIKGKTWVI